MFSFIERLRKWRESRRRRERIAAGFQMIENLFSPQARIEYAREQLPTLRQGWRSAISPTGVIIPRTNSPGHIIFTLLSIKEALTIQGVTPETLMSTEAEIAVFFKGGAFVTAINNMLEGTDSTTIFALAVKLMSARKAGEVRIDVDYNEWEGQRLNIFLGKWWDIEKEPTRENLISFLIAQGTDLGPI